MTLPLLIEAEQLANHLDDDNLLIIDLCSEDSFKQGHIPGAVHVAPKEIILGEKPAPGKLPPLERLSALFERLGLTTDTHVVCYDDEGSGWAGRFIWTLDIIGHTRYSCLDGGILAWRAANLEESQQINEPKPVAQNLTLNTGALATAEDILAELADPHSKLLIWDARSPAEYAGEKVLAQKGGHIPGAINAEWTSLMDMENQRRLRKDAKDYLQSLGITADKSIVTHCQTHHRSGLTYLAAKILGFPDIRAYAGSWSEWGNREDTPVEQ